MQYILGEWDFQGLNLKMVPPVFIPRPETEVSISLAQNGVEKRFKGPVLPQTSSRGRWGPMATIHSTLPHIDFLLARLTEL